MLWVFDWITILIASVILYKSIKSILIGRYSILHMCVIVFYVMQILPIGVEYFIGLDKTLQYYRNMYVAMTGTGVGIIYDLLMLFVICFLYFFAQKYRGLSNIKMTNISLTPRINVLIKLGLWIGMLLPLMAVMFAPKPSVYLQFAYFYRNTVTTSIQNYHSSTIMYCNMIALFCTLVQYWNKKSTAFLWNLDIVFAIALFTWINQKRTLFTFALIGILVIDVLKKTYVKRRFAFVGKVIIFVLINVLFFYVYSQITGKGSDEPLNLQYYMYYSRMNTVKTSIYDVLNGSNILEYPGQSILFNLLFFVPRIYWPSKPAMYVKYFSAYAVGNSSADFISWNFQVNIWSEYLSNFGFLGILVALLLVIFIAKTTEKSNNYVLYLIGAVFLVLYFVFGFEGPVMAIWLLWWAVLLLGKVKITRRIKSE